MRHSVLRFALAMDDALGKNVSKGHWRKRPLQIMRERLMRARLQLDSILHDLHPDLPATGTEKAKVLYAATSVANYAMMLADEVGALKEPWQP